MAGVVSVLAGAVLGWVLTDDEGLIGRFGYSWSLALLAGMELFIAFAGAYIVEHKNNYTWFLERMRRTDPGEVWQKPHFEVFGWLMAMLGLVEAAFAVAGIGAFGRQHFWCHGASLAAVWVLTILYWCFRYHCGLCSAHPIKANGRSRCCPKRCRPLAD